MAVVPADDAADRHAASMVTPPPGKQAHSGPAAVRARRIGRSGRHLWAAEDRNEPRRLGDLSLR